MTSAKTFPASAPPKFASIGSPYFGIMLAVMAVMLILSNIGASKGVALGPIVTDGGFFLLQDPRRVPVRAADDTRHWLDQEARAELRHGGRDEVTEAV